MREEYSADFDRKPTGSPKPDSEKQSLLVKLSIIVLAICALLLSFSEDISLSPRIGWFLAGGSMLVLIVVTTRILRTYWLSAPIVYMIVFWVFHFGLIFPASVAPNIVDFFPRWGRDWLFLSQTSQAIPQDQRLGPRSLLPAVAQ